MSEEPIRKASSLATIQAICEKPDAVKILRAYDKIGEPAKVSQIEEISGVSYQKTLDFSYRLSDMKVLELLRNPFETRVIRFGILDQEFVKRVFDYDDKQRVRRRTGLGAEGVTEV